MQKNLHDEFAYFFPEFERLKQLNKIACIVSQMNHLREKNSKIKEVKEKNINDNEFLEKVEKSVLEKISSDQLVHLTKLFQGIKDEQIENLKKMRENLQSMRNEMGSFTYHTTSPEVTEQCNQWYNTIKSDLTQKGLFTQYQSQIWPEIITPKIPTIVNQLNTLGQQRKQNYRNQVYNLYLFLVNEGSLQPSTYNTCIDDLMNNSNVESLAQALSTYTRTKKLAALKKEFKDKFPGTETYIDTALSGNVNPLTVFISDLLAKQEMNRFKKQLSDEIQRHNHLETNFESIGLGKLIKDIDLSGVCHWIPASIRHDENTLVYGGVVVTPTTTLLNKISQQTTALLLASSILLTSPPSYGSFLDKKNPHQYEIDNAKRLVQEVDREIFKLKTSLPFGTSTIKLDQELLNLKTKINLSETKQNSPIEKPTVDLHQQRGFGYTNLENRNVPLYDIIKEGSHGEISYTTYVGESIECGMLKSEANELLNNDYDGDGIISLILGTSTYNMRMKALQEAIVQQCPPVTEEMLKREAKREPTIYEMTPKEILELGKSEGVKLKNFVLKFFEKRKNEIDERLNKENGDNEEWKWQKWKKN